MSGEVRVLLVDDQELVRSGLRRILRPADGFVIAGECADGDEVPAALAAGPVDVIVMDLRMKRVDGIEATRRLRESGAHPPILALTVFDDDELLAGALRAGVAGFVLKDVPAEDLIRAVRAVARGAAWLDPAVTARVLAVYRTAPVQTPAQPDPEGLRLALLGPLRASRDGRQLNLGPVKQQAILAALVLRADRTVSLRELLAGLYGEDQPDTARQVVQVYIYRLRKILDTAEDGGESMIRTNRGGYCFVSAGTWVDVAALDELAAGADRAELAGDFETAAGGYENALGLYDGEPLAGLPGRAAAGQRQKLDERRLELSLRKLGCQHRLGQHPAVLGEAAALAETHPYSEQVAALRMRALHASGRRAESLALYLEFRRQLVRDRGVEPTEFLRRVHQSILSDSSSRP